MALRRMQNVILLSPDVADFYRATLGQAHTWVLENPVPQRFFEIPDGDEPNALLFCGLLIPRKGLPNLLEAVAIARDRGGDVRLRLAGQATMPEHERELRDTVRRLGLETRVEFLGGLSPEALAAELARAAVFVLVSKQETLPVAILEAMAAGKPVVASPVGGIPRVVLDGETGFLVPHGDPSALADHILRLLADPELRRRLGSNARRAARDRFTLDRVSRRTLEVYREVIERARR